MKPLSVSRVTPFLADLGAGKNLCFVKVETDGGPHGWGECYTQADRDQSIVLVEGQPDGPTDQGGRAVFAYLDLQHLTISAAPEPGVWISLVGGLFGAGALLRRRKAPIPA